MRRDNGPVEAEPALSEGEGAQPSAGLGWLAERCKAKPSVSL